MPWVRQPIEWDVMDAEATSREERRTQGDDLPSGGAGRVAAGIAVSRVLGFLREMVLAFFFGAGPHADVFRTALRGPNLLQNLLGEQTLSASFIPVYSRFLAAGRQEDAGRFAGAIFGLLLAVAGATSLVGVLLAEPIVSLLAPGYLSDAAQVAAGELSVDRFPLAVTAVRIIFPMTGILVLSAWALGVLNSHRRFFVSYVAPALWNAAIIAALFLAARYGVDQVLGSESYEITPAGQSRLVIAACLGALAGGLLQFGVQIPWALRLMRGFRPRISTKVAGVVEALRAFTPLLAGRGAVQISGYLDYFLASFLAAGAVAALGWAQSLYLLPISLFGMSVAAAELPELARRAADSDRQSMLQRVETGLDQMAFLTVPSAVCYLAFGYLVIGALFRRGQFGVTDNWLVYLVLAGYSLGLVASTTSRLLNNIFYALGQTRVPARIAVERVVLSAGLGVAMMLWLDRFSVGELLAPGGAGSPLFLGAVGLALGAGISSWYELARLLRALTPAVGRVQLPWGRYVRLALVASLSVLPGWGVWVLLSGQWPLLLAAAVLVVFGAFYLALTRALGLARLGNWLGRSGGRHQD